MITGKPELDRIHSRGRGLVLNTDGRKLHAADCYHVGTMDLTTNKLWFEAIHEVDEGGWDWNHHCPMCEI